MQFVMIKFSIEKVKSDNIKTFNHLTFSYFNNIFSFVIQIYIYNKNIKTKEYN